MSNGFPLVFAVSLLALIACIDDIPPPTPTPPRPHQPRDFDADIAIADAHDLDPDPDLVEVNLTASLADVELQPGVVTTVWAYNDQVPGPTLRVPRGAQLKVNFTNQLPEATTIHWHGLRVPAAMDGTELMQAPIETGGTFTYVFTANDSGTYWYHPHMNSSAQLGFGLYGAIVVEDDDEPFIGDEVVLVLSDVGLDAEGQLLPGDASAWFGDFFGREGTLALVNGRVAPILMARAGLSQHWRIVNASRARYVRLALPQARFVLVARDAGRVSHPEAQADIVLPPGARAEVMVEAQAPGQVLHVDNWGVDRFHINRPIAPTPLFDVHVTDESPSAAMQLPPQLNPIEPLATDAIEDHDIKNIIFDTVLADDGNTYFSINGALGDAPPIHASVDSTQLWRIENTTTMDHPFHLHGFFFQIIDVNGTPPANRAWLDTVNLAPRDVVRIGIPFDDRAGMWMFHCHILDHTDKGMMQMLMVE